MSEKLALPIPDIGYIRKNAGNALALDAIYRAEGCWDILDRRTRFFMGIPMMHAVLGRARVVANIVAATIEEDERPARIVSLAAGLARPLLNGVRKAERTNNSIERIMLTDMSRRTLDLALGVGRELRIRTSIDKKRLDLRNTDSIIACLQAEQPTIVEAIGFPDYFDDRFVTEFFRTVREGAPEATLITGNVMPIGFWQRFFIEKFFCWPRMHYRKEDRFLELLLNAGYESWSLGIEPQKIFLVVRAKAT